MPCQPLAEQLSVRMAGAGLASITVSRQLNSELTLRLNVLNIASGVISCKPRRSKNYGRGTVTWRLSIQVGKVGDHYFWRLTHDRK